MKSLVLLSLVYLATVSGVIGDDADIIGQMTKKPFINKVKPSVSRKYL